MTLFELRNEVKNRKLCTVGKKNALLTRLLVWVRDEICRSFPPGTLKEEVKSNSLVNPTYLPIFKFLDKSIHHLDLFKIWSSGGATA